MKIKMKAIKTVLCICAAFGWWGVLYPELAMTPDTYRVVREEESSSASLYDSAVQGAESWDFDRGIYFEILQAEAGQVRFKSKLLTSLKEIFQ